ncbi:hypothetical protein MSAN_01425600 [Mycena sanguinolenta]|uniref:Uncharacterized protein n=1 Tax=Mycena sanguinolenta TaxID=230812 RepID=A0A8H6YBM3_9AGAR|nr:hypothetical protein MSAN_01425600 [Mycena sanguinolenta]
MLPLNFCPPACKRGSLVLVRRIRTKSNRYFSPSAEREEEILLKRLETQVVRVKERLAKEEEAKRKSETKTPPKASSPPPIPTATPLNKHASSLWDELVNKDAQGKLAAYGIKSMDQLQEAYREADADMNRPPYPSVQRLKPRLRLAWETYQATLPQKFGMQRRKLPEK